jgi:hypothetical protein
MADTLLASWDRVIFLPGSIAMLLVVGECTDAALRKCWLLGASVWENHAEAVVGRDVRT